MLLFLCGLGWDPWSTLMWFVQVGWMRSFGGLCLVWSCLVLGVSLGGVFAVGFDRLIAMSFVAAFVVSFGLLW